MRKWTAVLLAFFTFFGIFSSGHAEVLPVALPYETPMDGTIRVMLQSLGSRTALGLTLDGSYSVDGGRGFQFARGTEIGLGIDGGSIVLAAGGATIDMGEGFTLARHLNEDGSAGGAYIHESEKDTLYCGDLSFDITNGSLRVIVTINIEEYLYGVVPYEMSDTFPLEALKAQAVAARTYAMQRKARNQGLSYDVVDTTNDQVYKGLDARFTRPIQAVDETRGIVGMQDGSFAECFYSASNGGQTALATDVWGKGDFDYLDIRDDPYDLANPDSVVKSATVPRDATRLSEPLYGLLVDQAAAKLHADGTLKAGDAIGLAEIIDIEAVDPIYAGESRQYGTLRFTVKASVRKLDDQGEFSDIETVNTPISIDLSLYSQVRGALNIAINTSSYELVEVTAKDDGFSITTRRFGHGVGLSQRGAQWMASAHGKTYLEILNFYYPGLQLYQVTWTEKQLVRADALPESLGYAAARPTPAPTPAPLPALQPGEYYAVVTIEGVDSILNVREGPTMDDDILYRIRTGSRLIVVEELPDGWAKMKTAEVEGYVSMAYITREGTIPAQEAARETPLQQPSGDSTAAPEGSHVF